MTEIREQMEAIGADGVHVGTVDKVKGSRIKLTKWTAVRVLTRATTTTLTEVWLRELKVTRFVCRLQEPLPSRWKKRKSDQLTRQY